MTGLSPAAEAVLNAYENSPRNGFCLGEQKALAAALRAAADQVIPPDADYASNEVLMIALNVRHQFLAIATELEEVND
jgi:hypothetical protein